MLANDSDSDGHSLTASVAPGGGPTPGSLTLQPTANSSGTATITVTVIDSGGILSGGVNTFSQSFTLTILPVNQAPTLGSLAANSITINENTPTAQVVNLVSITAGPGDVGQTLTVTAVSSNPGVIPNPAVNYASPSASGTISYTPVPNASGAP